VQTINGLLGVEQKNADDGGRWQRVPQAEQQKGRREAGLW